RTARTPSREPRGACECDEIIADRSRKGRAGVPSTPSRHRPPDLLSHQISKIIRPGPSRIVRIHAFGRRVHPGGKRVERSEAFQLEHPHVRPVGTWRTGDEE